MEAIHIALAKVILDAARIKAKILFDRIGASADDESWAFVVLCCLVC